MLTGGHVAACTAVAQFLAKLPACEILHGDKDYDSAATRGQVEEGGAMPNVPPKTNRSEILFLALPLPESQRHTAQVLPPEGVSPWPRATTETPQTSSPPSASPQSSATSYESGA
jgi:hypothetical protein